MSKRHLPTWRPSVADYEQVFNEQNPWWLDGKVPEAWARQIERPLVRFLWQRLHTDNPRRFQLVLGPRRVGKTTSMYQTVKQLLAKGVHRHRLWWLRLDHPLLMEIPLGELVTPIRAGATTADPAYLFLDELTYADKWDLWLKTFYDETWPVRIAGSSSSTAALRDRRLESGVGRWEEQYLAPYLFAEYLDLVGIPAPIPVEMSLAETIDACIRTRPAVENLAAPRRRFLLTGGFPELLIGSKDQAHGEQSILLQSQRTLRNDAVERAIYKDIPQAFGVQSPKLLERMLYILAGQFTGILSPKSICKGLDGLSQPTFDRYLAYLERAFLVFTLENYSGSEVSKQKRGRKLYFVDGAVRNAALQRGIGPLNDLAEMGLLIENLVAGHLHALSQQSQIRVYHWRQGNEEVDLIYDHPERPLAFEIGSSASHHRRGLQAFMERFPRFKGRTFLVAPDLLPRAPSESTGHIGTLPLDLLLLAISSQAERELQGRLRV
ncbi:MAG TPA: ATP-binding protein [Gemmataceae bacterium]|nr:ATP-binding protein [Gemmataceae bacterium]